MSAVGASRSSSGAWLERADPRFKLAALAWVSTLSVVLDAAPALLGLALVAALLATGLRVRPGRALALAGLLAAIAWGTMFSQAIFYAGRPRTPLVTLIEPGELWGWELPGLTLYREGFVYGLKQSLRMIAVTIAGLSVCLSTGPERLFAALAWLRVPSALGFMTVAALRMLPLLAGEYLIARQARRLRGGSRTARPRPWRRLRSETDVLVPVLAAALRRATALATSVSSRGFNPAARRTYYPPLKLRQVEWGALGALAASATAIGAAKLIYWLYLSELYYRPELRGLYAWVREWL